MRQHRPTLVTSISLAVATVIAWWVAAVMTSHHDDPLAVQLARSAAATVTCLAGMAALALFAAARPRERELSAEERELLMQERDLLIRTLACVAPAARREAARTRPMRPAP